MLAKVNKIHKLATFDKAHDSDIGFDLTCCGWEVVDGVRRLFLGVIVEPQNDLYFMLVPRSSFCKQGWTQANCVGIIDSGYRGEWMMNIAPIAYCKEPRMYSLYHSDLDSLIGPRVAQAIPQYNLYGMVEFTEQLNMETDRGKKGYGSTGK